MRYDIEDLKAFLADKLAKYEMPTEMEIRETLPKTPVGKLSKKELVAEELAKRRAPRGAGARDVRSLPRYHCTARHPRTAVFTDYTGILWYGIRSGADGAQKGPVSPCGGVSLRVRLRQPRCSARACRCRQPTCRPACRPRRRPMCPMRRGPISIGSGSISACTAGGAGGGSGPPTARFCDRPAGSAAAAGVR